MWKVAIFRKALVPMLRQIDAEYNAPEAEVKICNDDVNHALPNLLLILCLNSPQESNNSEPEAEDGPSIELSPAAPVVLFGKNAPPLSKVLMQSHQTKPSPKASAK